MATKTLVQFRAVLDTLLSADDDELDAAGRQESILSALERYSVDRPEQTTFDLTGDAGKYYPISSVTGFVDGFSHVIQIEYPAYAVSADHEPVYLDPEDWDDNYWAGGLRYVRFPNHAPAATETVRITFTAPYAFSSGSVTIPTQDYQAICHLSAGLACGYIATKYSRTTDSTIGADSVDHLSRADQFSRRAREFVRLYEEHMRLGEDAGPYSGAAEFVDWDTAPDWPSGRNFLFHGRGVR